MSIIKSTDSAVRLVNSIIFRLIIVFYGITILAHFDNAFNPWFYLLGILAYLLVYLFLFNKNKIFAFLRLFNDYAFIVLILYNKDLNNLHSSLFLLLPLINNLNHSGGRKIFPFSLRLYAVILSSYFVVNKFAVDWYFIIPLISISLINCLVYFRLYLIDYVNNLYAIIEDFYKDNLNIGKTHRILKGVLDKHRENKFVNNLVPIKSIVLFQLKQNHTLKILLSSKFVVQFRLLQDLKSFDGSNDKVISDLKIELDGRISEHNLFILKRYKNNNYIYFVEFSKKSNLGFTLGLYINKVLQPLLTKITQVAYIEYQLSLENKKYFKELKSRVENIDSAVNAIHYLNNKLSPVLNYFEMLRLLPQTSSDKVDELKKLIEREKKIVFNSIGPITEKMNQMAEKTMNASIISDTKPVSLRKLFTTIRSACDDALNLTFTYDSNWSTETLSRITVSNLNLITFILDELIINLEKHSTGHCDVSFTDNEMPQISFNNKVKSLDKNRVAINKIIDDFNQDNVNEIMKRNSNGLRIIKQYLIQLNHKHQMMLVGEKLVLTLTLKLEDENFNI